MFYIRNPYKSSISEKFDPLLPFGKFSLDYAVAEIARKLDIERYKASLTFREAIANEDVITLEG